MVGLIQTREDAEKYCNAFITPDNSIRERSLGRIQHLMSAQGNPEKGLRCIHVTGSSGKSSTAYFTASILEQAGMKVGLHIKPHLQSITERISINRIPISDAEFVRYINALAPAIGSLSDLPTYFEILVALAILYFRDNCVDIAVFEVGRGGRVDATNVCDSQLVILTNVALVHTDILGKTLIRIANEKMALVRPHATVVTGVQQRQVQEHIKALCRIKKARLAFLDTDFSLKIYTAKKHGVNVTNQQATFTDQNHTVSHIPLLLKEDVQKDNAALAIAAALRTARVSDAAIRKAFASVMLPGRMETIRKNTNTIIMDSAHNPIKMKLLIKNIQRLFPHQKMTIVIPAQFSSGAAKMLKLQHPIASEYLLVDYAQRPATKKDEKDYKKALQANSPNIPYRFISLSKLTSRLMHTKQKNPYLVTESMTLIGALRTGLHIPYRLK